MSVFTVFHQRSKQSITLNGIVQICPSIQIHTFEMAIWLQRNINSSSLDFSIYNPALLEIKIPKVNSKTNRDGLKSGKTMEPS